jgi:hypothetical protein
MLFLCLEKKLRAPFGVSVNLKGSVKAQIELLKEYLSSSPFSL